MNQIQSRVETVSISKKDGIGLPNFTSFTQSLMSKAILIGSTPVIIRQIANVKYSQKGEFYFLGYVENDVQYYGSGAYTNKSGCEYRLVEGIISFDAQTLEATYLRYKIDSEYKRFPDKV